MRCQVVVVLLLMGWLSVSCAENQPAQSTQQQAQRTTILSPPVSPNTATVDSSKQKNSDPKRDEPKVDAAAARKRAPLAVANAPVSGNAGDMPVPPKGAQYTIFCLRVDGESHVERANRIKSTLQGRAGLNGWYVIHEDRQSILYHGFYRAFNDPRDPNESARAQNDRKRIEALTDEMKNRLFVNPLFVDVESPDPAAPREWDLANAKGFWTLQIAAYKDSPQRKEAAVDAVREARAQGIEAYFYHGESVSSVCIGTWPEEAVRYQRPNQAGRLVTDSMMVAQPVIVDPNNPNTPSVRQLMDGKDAKKLNVMEGKVEIVDPSLLRAMKQYPNHAVNGMQMVKRMEGKEIPDPSLLVKIPHLDDRVTPLAGAPPEQPNGMIGDTRLMDPTINTQSPQPPPQQRKPQQQPQQQPGLGKLKSVGG